MQIHSDQGTNFTSAVFKGLCQILGIDKTQTTPLHPQSDGMVERFNRTILNNLSLLVSRNQQDWDLKLPLFLLAYRSAGHETTGYTLSQMLFGHELCLPCHLFFGCLPDTPSSPGVPCRSPGTICRCSQFCSGANGHGDRKDEDEV